MIGRSTVARRGRVANRDDWCTPSAVDKFDAALKSAGIKADIHRYEADHGFVNEQRSAVHDRPSAELAWSRTLAFCKLHLG